MSELSRSEGKPDQPRPLPPPDADPPKLASQDNATWAKEPSKTADVAEARADGRGTFSGASDAIRNAGSKIGNEINRGATAVRGAVGTVAEGVAEQVTNIGAKIGEVASAAKPAAERVGRTGMAGTVALTGGIHLSDVGASSTEAGAFHEQKPAIVQPADATAVSRATATDAMLNSVTPKVGLPAAEGTPPALVSDHQPGEGGPGSSNDAKNPELQKLVEEKAKEVMEGLQMLKEEWAKEQWEKEERANRGRGGK